MATVYRESIHTTISKSSMKILEKYDGAKGRIIDQALKLFDDTYSQLSQDEEFLFSCINEEDVYKIAIEIVKKRMGVQIESS